tara:strand:+ start:92 stop:547 length:456 start_codon:yes stop_codon:yes gene_type:complete
MEKVITKVYSCKGCKMPLLLDSFTDEQTTLEMIKQNPYCEICEMEKITWNSDDPNMSYLKNNGLVRDTNGSIYVVDRKNGYILSLLRLNETLSAAGFKSVNVDPTSSEYDSENEYFTHEINGYSTLYELLESRQRGELMLDKSLFPWPKLF